MTLIDRTDKLAARALEAYGLGAQMNQAIEECAEFIVAARHLIRGKARVEDLCSEIADVTIMMAQMRIMVGPEAVDRAIEKKLRRLGAALNRREEPAP